MYFGFENFIEVNGERGPASNNLDKFHTLGKTGLSHSWACLPYLDYNFKARSVQELLAEKKDFFYILDMPYPPHKNWKCLHDFFIYPNVLKAIKAKKCKVLFCTYIEPFTKEFINTLELFAINNTLKKDDLYLITSEVNSKNLSKFFTTIHYNYFLSNNWFLDGIDEKGDDFSFTSITFKLKNTLPYRAKFLCLNRVTRAHRLYFFYRLLKHPELFENTLYSLGSKTLPGGLNFESILKDKSEFLKVQSFFKNRKIDIFLDSLDKRVNLAHNIPSELTNSTFLSIISETSVNPKKLFLSEKIAKGLYCKQPFIVLGNPGTLAYLKKLGFKTFNRWFDESYDGELDFKKRLGKIISLMSYLNTYPEAELFEMREKMNKVLEYNHKKIIEYDDTMQVFGKLNIYNKAQLL